MLDLTHESVILTGLFIFGQAFAGYTFLRPFPAWLTWLETLLIVAAPGLGILILAQRYPISTGEEFYRYTIFPALLTSGPMVTFQIIKYFWDDRSSKSVTAIYQKKLDEIEETHLHA